MHFLLYFCLEFQPMFILQEGTASPFEFSNSLMRQEIYTVVQSKRTAKISEAKYAVKGHRKILCKV